MVVRSDHSVSEPVFIAGEPDAAVAGAAAAAVGPPGAAHERQRAAAARHLLHGQTQTGETCYMDKLRLVRPVAWANSDR